MTGISPMRRWQAAALDAIRLAWREPDSNPLACGCPGSGKTLLGTTAAKLGIDDYGHGLVLAISPSVNVKENWKTGFEDIGLLPNAKVSNETLKGRRDYGESLIGDFNTICITYAQLAKEPALFAEMMRRYNGMVIADEPHHADENETFGRALNLVAEAASRRLALTGTPFNTRGRSLSMVPSVEDVVSGGSRIRRAIPTYSYSYGDAISEKVCRPVEFITVMGRGQVTYRSLLNQITWDRVVDLAKANKTDRLSPLLDPDGDFMLEMLETGIKTLLDIQKTDNRAGLLIAVADTTEGRDVSRVLRHLLAANNAWSHLTVAEVFHDTPGAHDRLTQLRHDRTDIVIAVRMISEGVDIPRLRVGVYATNYLTRLFLIQLIGRFIRWEARLDDYQFAKMVIPAHTLLLEWAREIEDLISHALIPEEGDDNSGSDGGPASEIIDRISQVTGIGAILRGDQEADISLASDFFNRLPEYVGRIPDLMATTIERVYREQGITPPPGPSNQNPINRPPRRSNARNDNTNLVRRIVRMMAQNGEADEDAYRNVNTQANRAVGIRRVDDLTSDAELIRRAEFLRRWLIALTRGEPWLPL